MKSNPSLLETVGGEKQKSPGAKTARSRKKRLQDVAPDKNDLQNLNDKAKGYPFSNYYKAKNNDPL